jgi:hypothetical protein
VSDPEARVSQWERDHDPEPPRDWAGAIPFDGKPVPGGVGNEAADVYADLRDSGLDRDFAAAMVDASYMTFAEWRTHHAAV